MSKTDTYTYPTFYRAIAVVLPAAVIMIVLWLLILPVVDEDIVIRGWRYALVAGVGLPTGLLFALSLHFMYPAVAVRGDEFRISTALYAGRWIPFSDLTRVRLPDTRLTAQIVAVGSHGLPKIYWVIGLAQGLFGPGFLIHPNIRRGDRLVQTLIRKRPDLFPPPSPKSQSLS